MAFFPETNYDFPNVGNYDGDLRELIAYVKRVAKEYDELIAEYNKLENAFNVLNKNVVELRKEVETFRQQIDEAVSEAIDAAMAGYVAELANINAKIANLDNEMVRLRDLVRQFLQTAEDYTNVKIAELSNLVFAVTADLQEQIDELKWKLPNVYNVVRGEETDLLTLVYDVYDALRNNALTVTQFDTLGLTAAQFDAKELTAYDFDVNGYDLLIGRNTCINPFTGERDTICNIIQLMAVNITGQTITASEFDGAELTVDEFEALDLDAYQFDFYAKQYIAA